MNPKVLKALRIIWPIWTLFVLAVVIFVSASVLTITCLIACLFFLAFVWLILS